MKDLIQTLRSQIKNLEKEGQNEQKKKCPFKKPVKIENFIEYISYYDAEQGEDRQKSPFIGKSPGPKENVRSSVT
ncbi:unnamed protein product [marine sediment metagenome]|uniref:Uncharacterized protein n=1 Tax=marine sediment metagenome TaxID=412755 RepID=X0S201_9ZZZZ